MKRVSKKQKRVKARNRESAKKISQHLVMGDQHDLDRASAEKLRSFPLVPRLKQKPFPNERQVGFAGHWVDGAFKVQDAEEFVAMNVRYKADAYYLRHDKRGNRKPRQEISGLLEVNVPFSAGLARELAKAVDAGNLEKAREVALAAGKSGMAKVEKRTGYFPAYMALHPDSEGTLSFHFGLWPLDREKRCLIGRSANGRRGRKGLRTIGDAFMTILRHHRAIGLPEDMVRLPMKNMWSRRPDDWAVGLAMDRTLRRELQKWPDGRAVLAAADKYQKEAAVEWLHRYSTAAAGTEKLSTSLRKSEEKLARRKAAAQRLLGRINERADAQVTALEEDFAREKERSRYLAAEVMEAKKKGVDKGEVFLKSLAEVRDIVSEQQNELTKIKAENEELDRQLSQEKANLHAVKEKMIRIVKTLFKAVVEGPKEVAYVLARIAPFLKLPVPSKVDEMANQSKWAKGRTTE